MIRDIEDKDIEGCLEIFNYYVLNTDYSFELDAVSLADYKKRVESITKTYPWLVIECDGVVAGFAYLSEFNYRKAYQYTADLTIYLHKDYLGRGLGSRLYYALEDVAKKMGVRKLVSLITAENKGSLAFHKAIGFKYLSTIDNIAYKFNKWCALTYFSKDLSRDIPTTDLIAYGEL